MNTSYVQIRSNKLSCAPMVFSISSLNFSSILKTKKILKSKLITKNEINIKHQLFTKIFNQRAVEQQKISESSLRKKELVEVVVVVAERCLSVIISEQP